MGQFIFWLIVFYLLYKFITGFVLPLIYASGKVKTAMRNMQENQAFQQKHPPDTSVSKSEKQPTADKGEYIDFEEIK